MQFIHYYPAAAPNLKVRPPSLVYVETSFPAKAPSLSAASKESSTRISRPQNSWVLYRSSKVREFKEVNPASRATQGTISKVVAELWRNESPEVKLKFEELAEQHRIDHGIKYPFYKLQLRPKTTRVSSTKPLSPSSAQDTHPPILPSLPIPIRGSTSYPTPVRDGNSSYQSYTSTSTGTLATGSSTFPDHSAGWGSCDYSPTSTTFVRNSPWTPPNSWDTSTLPSPWDTSTLPPSPSGLSHWDIMP